MAAYPAQPVYYPNQPPYAVPQQYPQQPPFPAQAPYTAQYPQQPGYPSQPYTIQPGQQPMTTPYANMRDSPVLNKCTQCGNNVTTTLEYKNGLLTWLIVGGLCLIGCIPCCLIPFCVNASKDVVHKCPSCGNILGNFKRI